MTGWLNCQCQSWGACLPFQPAKGEVSQVCSRGVVPADSAVLCLAGLRCSLENFPTWCLPGYPGGAAQRKQLCHSNSSRALPTPSLQLSPCPDSSWGILLLAGLECRVRIAPPPRSCPPHPPEPEPGPDASSVFMGGGCKSEVQWDTWVSMCLSVCPCPLVEGYFLFMWPFRCVSPYGLSSPVAAS